VWKFRSGCLWESTGLGSRVGTGKGTGRSFASEKQVLKNTAEGNFYTLSSVAARWGMRGGDLNSPNSILALW